MRSARWPVAVTLVAALASIAAQTPPAARRTAGSIVLLANASDHSQDKTLSDALLDPDPVVRTAAARVIAVVPHREMYKDLLGALAREQDPAASAELARSVLYLGAANNMGLVKAVARRFAAEIFPVIAEWTARMQPAEFIALLPELVTAEAGKTDRLANVVAMAAETHPDQRDAMFTRWMKVAPEGGWSDLLDRVPLVGGKPTSAPTLLVEALQSERPFVRAETVWFAVGRLARKLDVPKEVLDAALPADFDQQSEWERFGRELVARRVKKARPTDRAALVAAERGRHVTDLHRLSELPELTASERAAIPAGSALPVWEARTSWAAAATGRTMPRLAPGVIADTLSSAGCAVADSPAFGGGLETFNPDGRPRNLEISSRGLSPSCLNAFTALALTAVADPGDPVTETPQMLVLPLLRSFVECSSEPAEAVERSTDPPQTAVAPRKLRDVKPDYPQDAQAHRIQGVVIIDGTIGRTGCVRSARVIRSIPPLDVPALIAVSQWEFEPALVNGVPRAVLMTVTVNFMLR